MTDKFRGRKDKQSKEEYLFWEMFPELLMDDPEDSNNELIGMLRNMTQDYFKGKGRGSAKTVNIFNVAFLIGQALSGKTCAYLTPIGNVMMIREDIYNKQIEETVEKNLQTRLHKGMKIADRGNCLPAVISCLLDLNSAEDVIQVQEYFTRNDEDWKDILRAWLACRSLKLVYIKGHKSDGSYYLVSGNSANVKGGYHICIYKDGKLVHDTYPKGKGLLNEDKFQEVVKLNGV